MKMKFSLIAGFCLLLSCQGAKRDNRPANCDAEFKGGAAAMQEWIVKNVSYPEEAMENDEEGKVYVLFLVDAQGKVHFLEIEQGVSRSLDHEARRLIRIMPDWLPSKKNGKGVECKCRLPINFEIN